MSDTQGGAMLEARVTHLRMLKPPARPAAMPTGQRLALMRATTMPLSFYRYLYEEIGKPHHWQARRGLADEALAAIIHAPETEIQVLYVDGSPAGFFELDLKGRPDEIELVYFGISSTFQGRGLGLPFLHKAVQAGFAHAPARMTLHTNTLDSPRALRLYQKAGFSPYASSQETVAPWT